QAALKDTHKKLLDYKQEISHKEEWEKKRAALENAGSALPSEQMAVNLQRAVDAQAAASGLVQVSSSPGMPTQEPGSYFEERSLNLNYQAGDKELVDFLYNIGADKSMIRVRELNIKPDPALTRLGGTITLVASYQKATAGAKPAPPGSKISTNA